MSLFKTKLTMVLGAAFAAVLTFGTDSAQAAPPEGMRWIDIAAPRVYRTPSQPTRGGPAVQSPRFYSYAPVTATPAVTTPAATTSAPATISVRGPDGVVRTYTVEGPVVQQGTPAFVSIRGADGIIRTYPVVDSTPAAPTMTYPCR